jgi:hypothetical protein
MISLGGGRRGRKVVGWWIWWKYCVHMYVNGKMKTAKTIPGLGVGRNKEEW